jgi:predicted permease
MSGSLIQDLRYSIRQIGRNPGFTIVAVLTLALGIGTTTALFSVLDPLLLRKLPVDHPDQLVRLDAAGTLGNMGAWEASALNHFSDPNPGFSGIMAFVPVSVDGVVHDTRSGSAQAEIISANYFAVLGVRPYVGNLIPTAQEIGSSVILSFSYWQREFGQEKAILGKTIRIDGASYTVLGVTPPEFFGMRVGNSTDFYVPLAPGHRLAGPNTRSLDWAMAIGRLKPGISPAQAATSLQPVFLQIRNESVIPAVEQRQVMDHLLITSAAQGLSALRHRFSLPARILAYVVGLVLLIACSNVANLLLARGSARRRELTMRLALGARRFRLVQQLLTESAVLGLMGVTAGLLLARWMSTALVAALSDAHNKVVLAAGINTRVLLFSLATTLAAVVLSGLVPALLASRFDISYHIKSQDAGARSQQGRLGSLLVIGQVAMSVAALVAGGLLLHSLINLETMPVGFDRDHILAFDMDGNRPGLNQQEIKTFYERLLEKTRALPGVRSATLSSFAPVSRRMYGVNLKIEGYTPHANEEMKAFLTVVWPDYFNTLGIELLQGRDFTLQDFPAYRQLVIINRSLAQHYFPGENPIGKRLEFVEGNRKLEIIGVVSNSKYVDLREATTDLIYTMPGAPDPPVISSTLSLRTAGDVTSLRTSVPELIRSLDDSVHVTWIATLKERIDDSLHADRLIAALCGMISLLALLLTSIGLYGVLSYRVSRSTTEIGIRMALGAQREQIFRLIVGRGMWLVLTGLTIGLLAGLAAASLIKNFLYGVGRADPVTLTGVCLMLGAAAFAACFLPARRATSVEPLTALRNE